MNMTSKYILPKYSQTHCLALFSLYKYITNIFTVHTFTKIVKSRSKVAL